MKNFLPNVAVSIATGASASAQTSINCNALDMQNFESAEVEILLGSIANTGTVTVKWQHRDLATGSWEDIDGASFEGAGASDDNGAIAYAIEFVRKRYLRAVIERGTANSAILGGVYHQCHPRNAPVTHGTGVNAETVIT